MCESEKERNDGRIMGQHLLGVSLIPGLSSSCRPQNVPTSGKRGGADLEK